MERLKNLMLERASIMIRKDYKYFQNNVGLSKYINVKTK